MHQSAYGSPSAAYRPQELNDLSQQERLGHQLTLPRLHHDGRDRYAGAQL
ncbi:hypothetical protein LN650_03025 [Klebsiella pneumoniae subsp. pneumoniae]|nr:hypothetical protein [Klebsiella pneumoniae subsp. pneumoniae]